jgi:hypothetical protein
MRRRLSSTLTLVYKLILLLMVSNGLYWLTKDPKGVSLPPLLFLSLWCAVWYALTRRWKSVHLAGDDLYVSNYLKKIRIPLAEVKEVEASSVWGWHPRTVTLTLNSPSEFGDRIVFVPRGAGFGASEVARELKRMTTRG